MVSFESLDTLLDYVEYLKKTDISKSNIDEFKMFLKLSPEKYAKKFKLNELEIVKEFNIYKKYIFKKIVISEKVISLSKYKVNTFVFKHNGKSQETKLCVCSIYFESRFMHKTLKFYPTIKYNYLIIKNQFVLFPTKNTNLHLYVTEQEFNDNFIDIREYKINQILD